MTIVEVTVSDEVAHRMAKEMQAVDEHPWAACVEILVRDRAKAHEALRLMSSPRHLMSRDRMRELAREVLDASA